MWERGEAAERGQGMLGRTRTQGSLPDLSFIGRGKSSALTDLAQCGSLPRLFGSKTISTDIRCFKRINPREKK